MLNLTVSLTALAVFCSVLHAEPALPDPSGDAPPGAAVPANLDRGAALARVQQVIAQCTKTRQQVESCCHGNFSACNSQSGVTAKALLKSTNDAIVKGATGMSAVGAAVAKGEMGDHAQDLANGASRACADARNSCAETCNTSEQSVEAQFPETTPDDFAALRGEVNRCMKTGVVLNEPQMPKAPGNVSPPGANPDEPVGGGYGSTPVPVIIPGKIGGGYPGSVPTANNPVVIEDGNREFRNSLKDDPSVKPQAGTPPEPEKQAAQNPDKASDDGEPKKSHADDALNAFAKMQSESVGHSSHFESERAPEPVAPVYAAPASVSGGGPANVPLARGSVGLHEGYSAHVHAPVASGFTASSAPATAAGFPPAVAGHSAGFVTAATTGKPARGGSLKNNGGSGFESLGPEPDYKSPYKQVDTGVDGGGGGRASKPAANAPQLKDYLPNARLGPSSRSVAGGSVTKSPEILSQGKDVWQNMSMRMQYFCKIGRLRDCN